MLVGEAWTYSLPAADHEHPQISGSEVGYEVNLGGASKFVEFDESIIALGIESNKTSVDNIGTYAIEFFLVDKQKRESDKLVLSVEIYSEETGNSTDSGNSTSSDNSTDSGN